jgi:antibiotic biosynthesis monooxygenase (ABM) superfamily enzyme
MIREQPNNRSRARRWLAAVAMTLGAWLVAFLVVTALLNLLRDELASLPLGVRALVISGVLVALMVNLVMPALSAAIARWLTPPQGRSGVSDGEDERRAGGKRTRSPQARSGRLTSQT